MNAIISRGDKTAHVQLPVGRKQLSGALSYLGANHTSDYGLRYNEENKDGLKVSPECFGVVENAIYGNALSLSRPRQAAGASSLPEGAFNTAKRLKCLQDYGIIKKRKAVKIWIRRCKLQSIHIYGFLLYCL